MNNIKLFSTIILLSLGTFVWAQLPGKAEDISPLLIGESFPDVFIDGTEGKPILLHNILNEKPTVLVFYRGDWCPYCNAHLSELGTIEEEIIGLGYQIVAISPDALDGIGRTAEAHHIRYRLFSDAAGELTKAVGIAFKAPDQYGERLLKSSGGKNTGFLPVPSVFVLNQKGEILFEYINPDYKIRLSSEMLLAVLKALSGENP